MEIKTDKIQQYEPRDFNGEPMTARDKAIATAAFNAGRAYEASLFSDVLNTIVLEVRRYRDANK